MIEAKHQWWAVTLFHLYIYRQLKNHFAAFNHFESFAEPDPDLPTLIVPNHNTWWDGFFFYFLNKEIYKQNDYLMMLESQLRKYPFFSRIGVYGIDPENPKAALRSLRYTVDLMKQKTKPRSIICIFPEGELQSWNPQKIKFKSGIDWIIKEFSQPINLVPLGIRCELRAMQTPDVFFSAPKNYILDHKDFKGIQWLEETCRNVLVDLEHRISESHPEKIILKGRQKHHDN